MNISSYFLYTAKQKQLIAQRIAEAQKNWQEHFQIQNWSCTHSDDAYSEASLQLLNASLDTQKYWHIVDAHDTNLQIMVSDAALINLFSDVAKHELERASSLVEESALLTLQNFLQSLLGANAFLEIKQGSAKLGHSKESKGSGAWLLQLTNSKQSILFLLSLQTIQKYLLPKILNNKQGIKQNFINRKAALIAGEQGRVRLRLKMGNAQLNLSELVELAPGQVLRLDQAFDEMLAVSVLGKEGEEHPCCQAVLGQQDEHKAMQLFL